MKNGHFQKLLWLFIALAALACPLHQSDRIAPIAYYKMFLVLPALYILYALWNFRESAGGEREIVWSKLGLSVYAVAGISLLSLSWAAFKYDAIIAIVPWLIGGFTFFLFENSLETEDDVASALKAVAYTGTAVAIIGIAQYLFKFGVLMQGVAPSATFGNKNMAAQFVAMSLPLALANFLKAKEKKNIFLKTIPLILGGVFILYVQSRGAWLSSFVGLGLFSIVAIFKLNIKKEVTKNHILALVMSLAFIVVGMNLSSEGFKWNIKEVASRAESTFALEKKGSSNQIRYSTWMNSYEMFKENWIIGVGAGNWRLHYPKYHNKSVVDQAYNDRLFLSNPHNEFLDYIVSTGVIGLIALACVVFFLFKIGLQLLMVNHLLGFAAFSSIAAICTNACFSFPFKTIGSMTVMACLLGAISKLTYILADKKIEDKKYFKDTNAKKFMTAFVCLLLLAFHGFYYSDILKGYNLFIKGQQIYLYGQNKKDRNKFFTRATPYFQRAFKYNPWIVKNLLYWSQSTFNTGLPDIGIDKIRRAVDLLPNDKILLKKQYLYFIKTGKVQPAKSVAQNIMKRVPYDFFGFWALGDILWKEKKYNEAVALFNKAKQLKPDLKFMPYVQKLMDEAVAKAKKTKS